MSTTATTFTPDDWAQHEKFVEMIRAAKRRKEIWVKKMQAQWEREDQLRQDAAAKHYYDIEED